MPVKFLTIVFFFSLLFSLPATSQSPVNTQTETAYLQAIKKLQPTTKDWINTTKPSWQKSPELSTLRTLIAKKFPTYNGLEKDNLALVAIVESIREIEKDHHDLKMQQQSFNNDETKLVIIKARLQNPQLSVNPSYYLAAETIIAKYSALPANTVTSQQQPFIVPKKSTPGQSLPFTAARKPVADTAKTKTVVTEGDSTSVLMKNIESTLQELHNKKHLAEEAFQNVDQKMNRLTQALNSVTKSMNDQKLMLVRSML